MATDKIKRTSQAQIFDCVPVPIPPGKKSRGRLWRPGDAEPSAVRPWLLAGAAATAALVVGMVIGRFLLP